MSAPEQIAKSITEAILEGALKPGDRLPAEEQLADVFEVSRPTVRRALGGLVDRRVLTRKRGRNGGYQVAEFHLPDLAPGIGEFLSLSLGTQRLEATQLFEVRHALEVLSAKSAARNRLDEEIEVLRASLPDPERSNSDLYELAAADLRFHRALAQASHNPLLISFVEATTAAFHTIDVDMEGSHPEMVVGHLPELMDAVLVGDEVGAAAAMEQHLRYFFQYVPEHAST